MKFPSDFLYGYSNVGYQYEGNTLRGPNIWDNFRPKKNRKPLDTDIMCDGYHRWEEDLDYLIQGRFNFYRLSLSMSRIMENPIDAFSYYNDIINKCHDNGIKIMVTLYHWDMPKFMQDKGGFQSREVLEDFKSYTRMVALNLHNADYFSTVNEPWCIAYLGYYYGSQAPGFKLSDRELMRVIHNINMTHGIMALTLKETWEENSWDRKPIGVCLNPYYAQCLKREVQELAWDFESGIFTSPIFDGCYPKSVMDKGYLPDNIERGDMEVISTPLDFYGINYYFENDCKKKLRFPFSQLNNDKKTPLTQIGWRIVPEGLLILLRKMNRVSHGLDVFVTENGYGGYDCVTSDGDVLDTYRWDYVKLHLEVCHRAIEEGIPLKGYLQWSLTDNFEWSDGYKPRFGGIYIDYDTQERHVKWSMHKYSEYMKEEVDEIGGAEA